MPFTHPVPDWNAQGAEPPESLKTAGWGINQKPPADYFNWFFYNSAKAIIELQLEAINTDQKGVPNGVATLGVDGKVPASQLNVSAPPDATTSTKGVVQLSNSTTSTSETLAATPKAVKTVDDKIGTLSGLNTTAKDNLVSAVNELFTFANDGKSKWSSVIGSPLVSTDTFTQMQSKTQTIKNTLATNLTAKGQSSVGTETMTALVNKVANVATGKKYATGLATTDSTASVTVSGLGFNPSIVEFTHAYYKTSSGKTVYAKGFLTAYRENNYNTVVFGAGLGVESMNNFNYAFNGYSYPDDNAVITDGFKLRFNTSDMNNKSVSWKAWQ